MTTPADLARVLDTLRRVHELSTIEEVASAVHDFADMAALYGDVDRTLLRRAAVNLLSAERVKGAARFVDAALREASSQRRVAGLDTGDMAQGSRVRFDEPEPSSDPVDGSALLAELVQVIQRYVQVKPHAAVAIALWVLHTHALEAAHCSPRLALLSPTKRCGKTTLLRLLGALVARPLSTANVSPAVLFRIVEAQHPTLLIDEADAFARKNEELRGLINAGHARDGTVLRCVGEDHEPRAFAVFGAVAIAAIGRLPDTIMDRAVIIEMQRKASGHDVQPCRRRDLEALTPLRRRCLRWVGDHVRSLGDAIPAPPTGLHDRAQDNWEPLLAIAKLAGGDWSEQAARAALALSGGSDDQDAEGLGVQLLADMREVLRGPLAGDDQLTTGRITKALHELDDRPWGDPARLLNGHRLGRMLRPFGIKSHTIRVEGATPKGYARAAFADAFARYLPDESATSATRVESHPQAGDFKAQQGAHVAHRRSPESACDLSDVADVALPFQEHRRVRRVL